MALVSLFLAACAPELESPDDFAFLKEGAGNSGGVQSSGGAVGTGGNTTGGTTSGGTMSGGMMSAGLPEPPDCAKTIFADSCGTTTCHGVGAPIFVDLESAGVAERLLDQPTNENSACPDQVFISSSGATDVLLSKLSDTPVCGSQMPYGMAPLSDTEVQCISDYVASIKAAAP